MATVTTPGGQALPPPNSADLVPPEPLESGSGQPRESVSRALVVVSIVAVVVALGSGFGLGLLVAGGDEASVPDELDDHVVEVVCDLAERLPGSEVLEPGADVDRALLSYLVGTGELAAGLGEADPRYRAIGEAGHTIRVAISTLRVEMFDEGLDDLRTHCTELG